jgi:hypothetical protein
MTDPTRSALGRDATTDFQRDVRWNQARDRTAPGL